MHAGQRQQAAEALRAVPGEGGEGLLAALQLRRALLVAEELPQRLQELLRLLERGRRQPGKVPRGLPGTTAGSGVLLRIADKKLGFVRNGDELGSIGGLHRYRRPHRAHGAPALHGDTPCRDLAQGHRHWQRAKKPHHALRFPVADDLRRGFVRGRLQPLALLHEPADPEAVQGRLHDALLPRGRHFGHHNHEHVAGLEGGAYGEVHAEQEELALVAQRFQMTEGREGAAAHMPHEAAPLADILSAELACQGLQHVGHGGRCRHKKAHLVQRDGVLHRDLHQVLLRRLLAPGRPDELPRRRLLRFLAVDI
mmetsp:Transcript_101386/g.295377  ORF Transcript_101386/g.295377 Transcript_101386/m.295377 type:complete len:310 (+) Transcript_101386:556-1485(+)